MHTPSREAIAANHARLAGYLDAPHRDDPEDPAQVWAMQMVLRVEKSDPPQRHGLLVAAARSAVLVCLDERSAPGGPWAAAMDAWCDARIRKIARRARGAQWTAAQQVWGVTASADEQARAYVPTMMGQVDQRVRKLQIEGTDVPGELPAEPGESESGPALCLWVNPGLAMTVGKTAAQVGHASMLGAALLSVDEALAWYRAGCPLQVCQPTPARWGELLGAEGHGRAIAVRDAGFTEIAPGSVTVITTARNWAAG
ncbi:peptidyl-tRNA hydrolase [Gordonia sp. X0973]|uniref:peptidyl-tRNA hydrolase n=1 Tax=Gordonia sp. X0973 TaxID=2742602 RepID=UPI000F52057C|nr:peptidyl-tRNA hydrolase [Gordonia sp. X0973]QKT07830.1 peptidyl-tRNA hydrolase [Gordonia sp. X0973]